MNEAIKSEQPAHVLSILVSICIIFEHVTGEFGGYIKLRSKYTVLSHSFVSNSL